MLNKLVKTKKAFIVLILLASPYAFSSTAGVIVMMSGASELFTKPRSKASGSGKQVKFENTYYTVKRAKLGSKVKWKDVVKTGPKAKMRISFKNGDSFTVGPGTAYSLIGHKKSNKKNIAKKGDTLNLIYGKVRAVISKKGPRNNLRVKTKSSVAGVRGTDFFIKYDTVAAKTKLSVMRGQVSIKPTPKKSADHKNPVKEVKAVMIKTGESAEVKAPPVVAKTDKKNNVAVVEEPVKVEVSTTSKEDFVEIQTETTVKVDKKMMAEATPEVVKQIEEMEKKTAEVILDDIKVENKELYKKVMKMKTKDVATLNSVVVGKLYKEAPKAVKKSKITEDDLMDSMDDDVYKKYFKKVK